MFEATNDTSVFLSNWVLRRCSNPHPGASPLRRKRLTRNLEGVAMALPFVLLFGLLIYRENGKVGVEWIANVRLKVL